MANRRWNCPHCGGEGWSSDGRMPAHDKPHGVACRKSGQKTEREIARERTANWHETDRETAYGSTERLSFSVRVF